MPPAPAPSTPPAAGARRPAGGRRPGRRRRAPRGPAGLPPGASRLRGRGVAGVSPLAAVRDARDVSPARRGLPVVVVVPHTRARVEARAPALAPVRSIRPAALVTLPDITPVGAGIAPFK